MATLPAPHTWTAGDDATSGFLQTLTDAINFLIDPPFAHVYQDTAISLATSGSFQVITFNQEARDNDTMHSIVSNTSRLVATTAGRYQIWGAVSMAANATGLRAWQLRKNANASNSGGTLLPDAYYASAGSATGTVLAISAEVLLAATDYIEVFARQDSGGALNTLSGDGRLYLAMRWLSTL